MTDIMLTGTLDLQVISGDFLTGKSTSQHQRLLLLAHPGDFMQHPSAGVGIEGYLNDEQNDLRTEIRSQFELDGMKVKSMKISGTKIEIEASYS